MHHQHRNNSLSRYQTHHLSSQQDVFVGVLRREKDWAEHHGAVFAALFVMGIVAFGSLVYYKASTSLAYIPPADSSLSKSRVVDIPGTERHASQYTDN